MKAGLVLVMLCLLLMGCKSVLPSSESDNAEKWESYEEVEKAFIDIELDATNFDKLKGLGFDPDKLSNVRNLTYLDIISKFMPNPSIKKSDLPKGVLTCIEKKSECSIYEIRIEKIKKKRVGNALLDVLGFKKHTEITGWKFDVLIIIHADLVVYKLSSGVPKINKKDIERKPLGPLQSFDIGDIINPF